jgi:uncharacterized GH25 family protein
MKKIVKIVLAASFLMSILSAHADEIKTVKNAQSNTEVIVKYGIRTGTIRW